jgi:hypothetical protein
MMPPNEKSGKSMGDKTRRYLADLIKDLRTSKPHPAASGPSTSPTSKAKPVEQQPLSGDDVVPTQQSTLETVSSEETIVPQVQPPLFAGRLSNDLGQQPLESQKQPPVPTKAPMLRANSAAEGATASEKVPPRSAFFSGNLATAKSTPSGEKKLDTFGLPSNRPKIELTEKEKALLKAFRKNEPKDQG